MNKEITTYLDKLFPNPVCELNYKKDYELLIAIVLSAQTTDKRVNKVTKVLFEKYPSIQSLSKANQKDIENIIREIGTYKRKSLYIIDIAQKLNTLGISKIPNDRSFLESLPGVGHKTANVFLSNIYKTAAIAVDTHVTRVSKRLGLVKKQDDVKIIEKKLMKEIPEDNWSKVGNQILLFGRYYCKAINPQCETCEIKKYCQNKKKNWKILFLLYYSSVKSIASVGHCLTASLVKSS